MRKLKQRDKKYAQGDSGTKGERNTKFSTQLDSIAHILEPTFPISPKLPPNPDCLTARIQNVGEVEIEALSLSDYIHRNSYKKKIFSGPHWQHLPPHRHVHIKFNTGTCTHMCTPSPTLL